MKVLLAILLAVLFGYFLGSLNFAIIVVKLMKGKDIRTMGSKNAGLTNTFRCCGKSCALLTLIGDLGKGVLAVWLSRLIALKLEAGIQPDNDVLYIGFIAGFFAIIGHIYPIYYNFKGGKGVLVGVSAFLIIEPRVFLALIIIFAVMLALSKYVSLASIIATAYCPLAIFLMSLIVDNNTFIRSIIYTLMSIPMAIVIIYMHRSNIERLKNGTESKFTFKSKAK
ncbi:MAG: glycerol-3-phosphate 1-O-acyltransferase PlsY [Ruminococcus sp.]|nr:glycerol-3-phosphate 1-O-acyltransferase PlsY [Ruminococcus sp.]